MTRYSGKDVFWSWVLIIFSVGIISLLFFCCGTVAAAEKVCDPKDPNKCAQPLNRGEIAPFPGQLLTTGMAISQAIKAHDCDEVTRDAVEEKVVISNLQQDGLRRLREIDNQAAANAETLLKTQLQEAYKAAERRWWEHPGVWVGVGFLVGVAAAVGAVYLGERLVNGLDHRD